MSASYFSIEDILAEESAVTCVFKSEVEDLGQLDSGNKQKNLPALSKVSLPLWLSTALYHENAVDIDLPLAYGKNFCSQLAADPKAVAFGCHPHFYEVGAKLALLVEQRERERIRKALSLAFAQRFVDIFRHAQNWREQDMSDLTRKYSDSERRLFQEEYRAATELEHWKDEPFVHYVKSLLAAHDEPVALAVVPAEAERETKRIRQ